MDNKTCNHCKEENPSQAVMCWSCYKPFEGIKPTPFEMNGKEIRFPQSQWWYDRLKDALVIFFVGALISSGWWRGKTRFWFLGAGLGFLGVAIGIMKREEAEEARKQEAHDWRDEGSPIHRICNTIMLYGIKDGASQIRMVTAESGIQVFYLIDDAWREQMKIPKYVWPPMKNELTIQAASGIIEFVDKEENIQGQFTLRMVIEPPVEEILLTAK